MNNAASHNTKKETQQASEKKWGKEVMKVGFTLSPPSYYGRSVGSG